MEKCERVGLSILIRGRSQVRHTGSISPGGLLKSSDLMTSTAEIWGEQVHGPRGCLENLSSPVSCNPDSEHSSRPPT